MSHVSLAFSFIKRERLFRPAGSRVQSYSLPSACRHNTHAVLTSFLNEPLIYRFRGELRGTSYCVRGHLYMALSHLSNGIDYARFLSSRWGDSVTFLDVPLVVLVFNSISYRTARTPGLDCRHTCMHSQIAADSCLCCWGIGESEPIAKEKFLFI